MSDAILTALSLSVSGSLLALLILALRPLVKNRIPKAVQYYAWLIVLLRLVLPLSFEGSAAGLLFSAAPAAEVGAQLPASPGEASPAEPGGLYRPGGMFAPALTPAATLPAGAEKESTGAEVIVSPAEAGFAPLALLSEHQTALWLAGAAASFLWYAAAYLRFARKVEKSCVSPHPLDLEVFERLRGNMKVGLFCSPYVSTPLLLGPFSPRIVIPQLAYAQNGMRRALEHILLHELTHARRRDLLYKWFAAAALSLHWFNPLSFLIRREINRACELACDEAVIAPLDAGERRRYGDTLLGLASGKRLPAGVVMTTMSEEKRALKERLVGIARYKKASVPALALSLMLALLLAGCGALLGAAKSPDPAASPDRGEGPAATVTPPSSPAAEPGAQNIPEGVEGVFQSWASILHLSEVREKGEFYGMLVDGAREGNLLTIERRREDGYTRYTIRLERNDEPAVEYGFLASAASMKYVVSVQGADLDGDGTDELILNLDYLNSGGWADTHVLALKDGAFLEILAALNLGSDEYDETLLSQFTSVPLLIRQSSCTGLRALCARDGGYVLQLAWPHQSEEGGGIVYDELSFDGVAWTRKYPPEQIYVIEPEEQERRVRALVGDAIDLPAELRAYYWPLGYYADIDGKGAADDIAYLHALQGEGEDERFFAVIAVYAHDKPDEPLCKVYEFPREQSYYFGAADLDGDGLSEFALVLGDVGSAEIHVLKPVDGALTEMLTLESGRPEVAARYAQTLVTPDIPWSWCNIALYEGRPALELTNTVITADTPLYYLRMDSGNWVVAQGIVPGTPTPRPVIPGEAAAISDIREAFLTVYFTSNYQGRYDEWRRDLADAEGDKTGTLAAAALQEYFSCFAAYANEKMLNAMILNRDNIKYEALAYEKGVSCVPTGFDFSEYSRSNGRATYAFTARLSLTYADGTTADGSMSGQITVADENGREVVAGLYLSSRGFVEDAQ